MATAAATTALCYVKLYKFVFLITLGNIILQYSMDVDKVSIFCLVIVIRQVLLLWSSSNQITGHVLLPG